MAITITPLLTLISDCDATTGWTAVGGTNTLNIDVPIQGTGCIHNYSASAADRGSDYDFGVDKDLSVEDLYFWFALSKTGIIGDYGSTGLRIRVTDAAGVWGEWNLFGKNTVPHNGWIPWTVRVSQTYDAVSGGSGPSRSAIRKVGWRANSVLAKGYIYFDAWRYGTGLKLTEGTATVPATWEDIFAADDLAANKYGVIAKFGGVYYLQGQIQIGDAAQTIITYFKDLSKVIVFKDARVDNDFYEIKILGAATYKTSFILGTKSGTAGISGCIINSQSSTKTYKITATDANIDAFGLYGCTFLEANTISLPVYATNHEVLNSIFEKCAVVLVSTCIAENCNFISADDAGTRVTDTSASPVFKNSNLISCPYGVRIPNTGTYKFDNLKFSGSTSADIDNTSGGLVTVNCVNGANPTTYTGNTVINNYVDVTVTVKDEAQTNIAGASVRISKLDDNSVVYMNEITDVNGIATESINYPGAVNLRIRARKSTTSTKYIPFETTGVMTSTGFSLTVTLYVDGNL